MKPIDATPLAVFRFFFGIILSIETFLHFRAYHIALLYTYEHTSYHFSYPYLSWIQPFSTTGTYIEYAVMGIAALLLGLGLFYRLAATAFFLTFTHLFLIDQCFFQNHHYLIILISFLLIFSNAHHAFSLNAFRHAKLRTGTVPFWNLFLLQAQIFVVYFFGGIAKINSDWLHGEPLRQILIGSRFIQWLSSFTSYELWVFAFSYGGLFFDLLIGIFFFMPRWRKLAFGATIAFNTINLVLFPEITAFPFLMVAALFLFTDPKNLRTFLDHQKFLKPFSWPPRELTPSHPPIAKFITIGVMVYLSIQCLVPLRHFLYEGNVSWTEEGHMFSWRMKLRDKLSYSAFFVTDPRTQISTKVDLLQYLNALQSSTMNIRPDLIYQFSQFLKKKMEKDGTIKDPIIKAQVLCSLNGRYYQYLIDPEADLTKVKYSPFSHSKWIMPLQQPKERLALLPRNAFPMPPGAITALTNPKMTNISQAKSWIKGHETVVGVYDGKVAKAYPLKILTHHIVINDLLGETPILVTYNLTRNLAKAYHRNVENDTLTFETAGSLRSSDIILVDQSFHSYWTQLNGVAFSGKLANRKLADVAIEILPLQHWEAKHPNSDVVDIPAGSTIDYDRSPWDFYSKTLFLFR